MRLRTSMAIIIAAAVVTLGLVARQPGILGSAPVMKHVSDTSNRPENLPDGGSTPVLVELFTSEGCSSCPPAEALLLRLGRTQPVRGADVIVLEEHVDYWDHLGWKDPFSSESATDRQVEYGEAFGGRQAYTPQMIVDGSAEFVGSSESEALRAIRTASQSPKPAVQLSWGTGDMLTIQINPQANADRGDPADVYLVVAENMLHSDVKRGENAGRALEHDGVTRLFQPLGNIKTVSSGFSSTVAVRPAGEWNRANLRAVVFVQDRHSHRVWAAEAIPFAAA